MKIDKLLEFDKVKEKWMELAMTDSARKHIVDITYYLDERELRKQLKDTTDARSFMELYGTPPLVSVEEPKEILTLAEKESCLTPYQLERMEKVLVAVRRLKDYLIRGKQQENELAYYELNLTAMDDLREEIARQIRGGEVDDYASKTLLQLR